jgi:hypothetical protein
MRPLNKNGGSIYISFLFGSKLQILSFVQISDSVFFFICKLRYPDDSFDRHWQPFPDSKHAVSSTHNVTSGDFWNLPPPDVFNTALVAEQNAPLVLQWPPIPLQNDSYYVALYFADTLDDNSRTFDVNISDYRFYENLTVTSAGHSVFATQWILSGLTRVILSSKSGLPPLINAGEVFGLFPIGRLTITRDGKSLVAFLSLLSVVFS